MMRKTLLFLGTVLATLGGSLQAEESCPEEVIDWEGCYAGVHLGYVIGDFKYDTGVAGPREDFYSIMGGIQGGYNWQCDEYVYGVEGDFSIMGIEAKTAGLGSFKERYMMTVRGRFGYAIDDFLPYVTLGGVITDKKTHFNGTSDTTIQIGLTAGCGVEYMVGCCWDQVWSVRLEYLYADCGKSTEVIRGSTTRGGSDNHIIRFATNMHF